MILAFHDPKADDDDGEGIVKRFASSLAENFWPAMIADQLVAHVAHVVEARAVRHGVARVHRGGEGEDDVARIKRNAVVPARAAPNAPRLGSSGAA